MSEFYILRFAKQVYYQHQTLWQVCLNSLRQFHGNHNAGGLPRLVCQLVCASHVFLRAVVCLSLPCRQHYLDLFQARDALDLRKGDCRKCVEHGDHLGFPRTQSPKQCDLLGLFATLNLIDYIPSMYENLSTPSTHHPQPCLPFSKIVLYLYRLVSFSLQKVNPSGAASVVQAEPISLWGSWKRKNACWLCLPEQYKYTTMRS